MIDWTWDFFHTDGGVLTGLRGDGFLGPGDDDLALTIEPAFNERAALHGEHYEGRVTDWQFLSGDREDPDRTSLDPKEPVTIRTGTCDDASDATSTGPADSDG